jgi:hypothetical protein
MGECLACLIDDAAGDDSAWRECEVDILEDRAFSQLDGSSSFEGSPLPVRDLDLPTS